MRNNAKKVYQKLDGAQLKINVHPIIICLFQFQGISIMYKIISIQL